MVFFYNADNCLLYDDFCSGQNYSSERGRCMGRTATEAGSRAVWAMGNMVAERWRPRQERSAGIEVRRSFCLLRSWWGRHRLIADAVEWAGQGNRFAGMARAALLIICDRMAGSGATQRPVILGPWAFRHRVASAQIVGKVPEVVAARHVFLKRREEGCSTPSRNGPDIGLPRWVR